MPSVAAAETVRNDTAGLGFLGVNFTCAYSFGAHQATIAGFQFTFICITHLRIEFHKVYISVNICEETITHKNVCVCVLQV